MAYPKIPYQRFCWVIGTTSFRTAQLNLKIEQQLHLLQELQQNQTDCQWKKLQVNYYELMHTKGFLTGNAKDKAKDARQKTSGLDNIGLIDEQRKITSAGQALLQISAKQQFKPNNPLNLDEDSFLYFRQLIKTSLNVDEFFVRPFLVLAYLLNKLDFLTEQEFTYFLPLCINVQQTESMIELIQKSREQKNSDSIEEIIFRVLMGFSNYQKAQELFFSQPKINEELICAIGMNRKSNSKEKDESKEKDNAAYDKRYFPVYQQIVSVFLHQNEDVLNLYKYIRQLSPTVRSRWTQLLFNNGVNSKKIRELKRACLKVDNPFSGCLNEHEIREQFFKYLRIFKAMATLKDYQDLNERYLSLSDTLIFADGQIRFDTLPKYFFADCFEHTNLYSEIHQPFDKDKLGDDLTLTEISPCLEFNASRIFARINADFGVNIQSEQQVNQLIHNERYERFHQLIKEKFNQKNLLDLLNWFEKRDDKKISQLVTQNAEIPTIFEYVLGIIWYIISGQRGNILDYMKLSLDADLLPKSHAIGGTADLVYEYSKNSKYPQHKLLLEATLATATNQRRMELEPVSRHLGEQRLKSGCEYDYCVFISTYLHHNVVADFRLRRLPEAYYYGSDDSVIRGMKIISLSTSDLKIILSQQIQYDDLYTYFEQHHHKNIEPKMWQEQLTELLGKHQVI